MFEALDISSSGLTAQRIRLDTIAQNVANMNTTRDANGKLNPYRRRFVVFAPGQADKPDAPGVHVQSIQLDTKSQFRLKYDPGNPDAGPDGNVRLPNVDMAIETVNTREASRAYEANVITMQATKSMIMASLRLIA
jgi:flagellar basal-body rod protein FlgC